MRVSIAAFAVVNILTNNVHMVTQWRLGEGTRVTDGGGWEHAKYSRDEETDFYLK